MKRLQKFLAPLLVLVLSAAAFGLMIKLRRTVEPNPIEHPPPNVEVATLTPEVFPILVKSQGTVEAATAVRVISEVDGKVMSISATLKKGGAFSAGDILVAIDDRDYRLAVTRATAQVASAQLRVTTVEAEAKIAESDWKELGRDEQASALLLRQPQLIEARSALAAAEADLAKAKLDLERTKIIAPFDGRVRSANVDAGQFVRRGEELASIFGVDQVEVTLPLPLADFAFLDLPVGRSPKDFKAKPSRVTLVGRFGRESHRWTGEIVRVGGEVDVTSRMASVVVAVEHPYSSGAATGSPPLRVGMFVTAEIEGRTVPDVYLLSRAQMWDERRALAVDREGRLRIRDLDVLRADRNQLVVSGGFEVGDRLCLSVVDIPQDGMTVNVVETLGSEGGE